jgi:hypothetical protein
VYTVSNPNASIHHPLYKGGVHLAGMRRTLLLVLCASFVISGRLLAVTSRMGETSSFAGDESGNGNRLSCAGCHALAERERDNADGGNHSGRPDDNVESGTQRVGGIPIRTTIHRTLSTRRLSR